MTPTQKLSLAIAAAVLGAVGVGAAVSAASRPDQLVAAQAAPSPEPRPSGYGKKNPEKMRAFEQDSERRRTQPRPFVRPTRPAEVDTGAYDPETEYAFPGGEPYGVEPGTDRRAGSVNENGWSGYIQGDRYQIFAGSAADGSGDGSLLVQHVPRRGAADERPVLYRLAGTAPLKIERVEARSVILVDGNGEQHVFDVPDRRFEY